MNCETSGFQEKLKVQLTTSDDIKSDVCGCDVDNQVDIKIFVGSQAVDCRHRELCDEQRHQ